MLCLGIDSGTKSTKSLVLDVESGEVIALAQRNYGTLEGLPPGHCRAGTENLDRRRRRDGRRVPRELGKRRSEIKAIGVSAQQHGLVALDEANEPLRPAKLWCDVSTAVQCAEFNKQFGGVAQRGAVGLSRTSPATDRPNEKAKNRRLPLAGGGHSGEHRPLAERICVERSSRESARSWHIAVL